MADALRQLALAEKPFALTHSVGIAIIEVEDVLHTCGPSQRVLFDRLAQLLHAKLHVVEVRDHAT